jgi:tetratricopeptide (TPR) repeat protein
MFGVAHFGKGLMFQAMGKYDIAITEFRMAIENDLHPEIKVSDNAYMNIGAIYMKLKAYQDAVQAYSKCVQSNPRNGLAHYYLGMSYLRAGDYENAEKEEEAAKKLGVAFTALSEELTKVKSGTQEETDKKEQSMEKKPKKTSKKKAEAQ